MGIDLGDVVVRRPVTIADYANKRLAIDAWNILYQFLASIRQADGRPLSDNQGRITSHLLGILTRTGALVEQGVRPVFVFDGKPHPMKAATLALREARKVQAQKDYTAAQEAGDEEAMRTKAQQTSRLTVPMVEEAKALLAGLGIPVVQAPGEGEAQASAMARTGVCDACVSQDFDALLFGAPRLVRNLSVGGRRKLPGKQAWVDVTPEEVPLDASLAALGLTHAQLVDVAILVGTDFHAGVKGVGSKRAAALVAKEGSVDAILRRVQTGGAATAVDRLIAEQADRLAERDVVRGLFLAPQVMEVGADQLQLRAPEPEAVRRLLVDEHGFGADRVEAGLARFAAARGKRSQATLF